MLEIIFRHYYLMISTIENVLYCVDNNNKQKKRLLVIALIMAFTADWYQFYEFKHYQTIQVFKM